MSAKKIVTTGRGWVNLVTTKFLTNVLERVSRGLKAPLPFELQAEFSISEIG